MALGGLSEWCWRAGETPADAVVLEASLLLQAALNGPTPARAGVGGLGVGVHFHGNVFNPDRLLLLLSFHSF